MAFAAVHQFHSGAADGDAVTNQLLSLQRVLRRAGYVSNVYARHIADSVADRILPIEAFEPLPSTVLLVHHSMGHDAMELITELQVPKVTIFHSITPAPFFEDLWTREHVHTGFTQLRQLARQSVAGIAVSNHNRKQMLSAGFEHVAVLPVRTDYSEFRSIERPSSPLTSDWLFVGRIAPNKCQHEIVEAFAKYRQTYGDGHLHLVGDDSLGPYVATVQAEIDRHDLGGSVTIHGKVPDAELQMRYQSAAALVCLSKHEGFGVPLLEAMAAGLPVIARDMAAVRETMGGAGILLGTSNPQVTAAAFRVLIEDAELRTRVIEDQDRRLALIENFDTLQLIERVLACAESEVRTPSVQIQGPFETSYSLAVVNRDLALALAEREYDVSIFATEGPGDYVPNPSDLAAHPEAHSLYEKSFDTAFPDIAIRQMFPPRVNDSVAGMTFQYFGWEESRLPPEYVTDFNEHLDGIGTMSTYVSDVLRNEGITVPIETIGIPVQSPDINAPISPTGVKPSEKFTFLQIGSAMPRKGTDILLRAYFESFTKNDDVRLILKTFPNPHNEVGAQLADLQGQFPNHPEVVWLDVDLDRPALDSLYRIADCYVHPARGEGFGLPVAEAMLAGIQVICTAAGGLADFVNADTATVIDHEPQPARTHLSLPGSMWFEPDIGQLKTAMIDAASRQPSAPRDPRIATAKSLIQERYSKSAIADRWSEFINVRRRERAGRAIAVVSTFNSRCGIAEYSANLYGAMGEWASVEVLADRNATPSDPLDEAGVRRVWDNHRSGPVDDLLKALRDTNADITHIQYNFGFFPLAELAKILRQESVKRPTVLTLHRTAPLDVDGRIEALDDITTELDMCRAIIVHQESDRRYLHSIGLSTDVQVLPIGSPPVWSPSELLAPAHRKIGHHAFTVGTYGFLLPHKGILYLLEAAAILRSRGIDMGIIACCAIHPNRLSTEMLQIVRSEIIRLGLESAVELQTDYLPPEHSMTLLTDCDVIVLPYDPTVESSSAAIRSVLPLARPIVTSDIDIFRDVQGCVRQIPSPVSPAALADELELLWLDEHERERLSSAVREFVKETSWPSVSRQTKQLYLAADASPRQPPPAPGE